MMSYLLKISTNLYSYILFIVLVVSSAVFSQDPEVVGSNQNNANRILNIIDNKRLEANIAANAMNRIAVVNDRIVNIFGDEGTFVVQTEEHTGQVFIKPTTENGDQPLAITLITENGITQDLTLNPIKLKPTTLILKPTSRVKQYNAPSEMSGFAARNQTLQDQWIQVMKQAVLGELAEVETRLVPKARKVAGFKLNYEKCYQAGSLLVQVWIIKNTTKTAQELPEKNFFKNGDLALSLLKRLLQPNEKTAMYVLMDA